MDPLTIASLINTGYNSLQDVGYNLEGSLSEDPIYDAALRGTAQDRHLINQLADSISNLFGGKTSADYEIEEGIKHARNTANDLSNTFNNVNSITGLQNTYNVNAAPDLLYKGMSVRSDVAASKINPILQQGQENYITNFYDQVDKVNRRQQRQNMMNYFAEGGSLEELNGVTKFNVGGTHAQNPYGGIQQGIASDGLPNQVEEGELKYNDYIYSARLKPSKSLLKQYNLPEKYVGKSFAEIGDKLQKESKDRPNDPISKTTLDEWMLRLQNAQEEYKAKAEERRLARIVNNMSDEEKASLLSSLEQPMAQQEGIDLGQPMYAKGGKIHIAKNKRGTFTAAAKKHGKSVQAFASQVLANKENYSPAMVRKANFARNSAKWHADGGHLFPKGGGLNPFDYATSYIINGNPYEEALDALIAKQTTVPEFNKTGAVDVLNNSLRNIGANIDEYGNIGISLDKGMSEVDATKPTYTYQTKGYFRTPVDKNGRRETESWSFNPEYLRYAPAVGSALGALTAALQPKDYTLANRLEQLASEYKPIGAPHIGEYRKYTPYDINLGDVENLGLLARALDINRGQNRATQEALNAAIIAKAQETNAKRNIAAQQANEANRLAVNTYNLGIDQFNAQRDTQYDQLNQQILANRINLLGQAAQAADASRTAWATNINSTAENAFNQLGNVGKDQWVRNQRDALLSALGAEGIKELVKTTEGRSLLTQIGYYNS